VANPNQAISRHGIARDVVKVQRSREGLDLTFAQAQHAQRFVGAARGLAPCRVEAPYTAV
jgi:hypothetical protein